MAGPSLEQWISDLGLQKVDDPDVDKPVYRKPFVDRIALSAELEEQICTSIREARERRNLSRSKLAPLLGLSEGVYSRYETTISRLTVSRLIHLCEVLGAIPEEILAPTAPHLWGETRTKAVLMVACVEKLRGFDEEILQDVLNLFGR
ncbi:helix-turn-helix domain-containing protein, partial [Sinorhizobium fredii]|uniref:helix-turn-helix domain-containing protein n=1 Tax=Rhizobium fredii TaxID=380 RepID=UPI0009B6BB44